MTFLSPAALWFALVGAGIVALYLLKVKRKRETVPSLEFWRQLLLESQVRSLFQRLKRWLSLLLWLAIAACLVLALGNPVVTAGSIKPETLVIVLDNSASMQAVEKDSGGRTRFELAREAIGRLVAGRPVQGKLMLIEAGARPRVVSGFQNDRRQFLRELRSLKPRIEPGGLGAALAMGRRFAELHPDAKLIVVSDGADAAKPQAGDVLHWKVGQTRDNLGIARIAVRVHRQRGEHHAFVRVVNALAKPVSTQLNVEVDDVTVRVEPLEIAANGAWEKTIVLQKPEGGVLRVAIDRDDALGVDNEAFAILQPIRQATVLLVSPPDSAPYFREALLAMDAFVDRQSSRILDPADYERLGPQRRTADLTIFTDCLPKGRDDARAAVFVNRVPESLVLKSLGPLGATRITAAGDGHPLMRFVNFSGVGLARARQFDLQNGTTVLAKSPAGVPLIFLVESPARRALCLAFDLLDSDLPVRNSFPILMRNAVAYFGIERQGWLPAQFRPADFVELQRPLPAGVKTVTVETRHGGAGTSQGYPARRNLGNGPTQSIGAVKVTIGDETAYCAVNLADESESRIAVAALGDPAAPQIAQSRQLLGLLPWQALAVLGCVMVCLEWGSYHARWTE